MCTRYGLYDAHFLAISDDGWRRFKFYVELRIARSAGTYLHRGRSHAPCSGVSRSDDAHSRSRRASFSARSSGIRKQPRSDGSPREVGAGGVYEGAQVGQ